MKNRCLSSTRRIGSRSAVCTEGNKDIYDERRRREIPQRGLRYVVINCSVLDSDSRGRLRRNRVDDVKVIGALFETPLS
jgi:hypothetical protein